VRRSTLTAAAEAVVLTGCPMTAFPRCTLPVVALLALAAPEARGVIKAPSPLQLFVRDNTQKALEAAEE
jgi:hypothetical protein